ncbi:MAG: UDP-N-acetylmuramoyl-tripeptide--D-alanyl-D-alanine ligase [Thermoleophilia bacterium]|nr:UDP-N-acetylmuramoyl-tripeptide--D-alanyl-D-alanine ligase [Thermoleophilia bacterium]
MIILSPHEAGQALGLEALDAAVVGVSIDSRTTRPGDLFIALSGQHHDGHQFVEAAFAAGASGAVVQADRWRNRATASPLSSVSAARAVMLGPIYEVPDTLAALGALAQAVRRKSKAIVFAVTGSVGKTTTKDLLAAMLGEICTVTATQGNQNNEIGVPLTLFSIEPHTEAVVVEMAMRGPGQIAALAQIAEPDIGVIVNVHPVHLELLGTIEAVAQAKAELLAYLPNTGAAVIPSQCEPLDGALRKTPTKARVVRFSTDPGCREAEVVGLYSTGEGGLVRRLTVRTPDTQVEVETDALPPYVVENVVAAAAACYVGGFPLDECLPGIRSCLFSERRWRVHRAGGLVVIDDTYNANPVAVKAAIDGLVRIAREEARRPVAILGDMLELGPEAVRYHEEVGMHAGRAGVAVLWGIGNLAVHFVSGFEKSGVALTGPTRRIAGHIPPDGEPSAIWDSLQPGDVVLFKASRALRLDRLADETILAARSGRWLGPDGKKVN